VDVHFVRRSCISCFFGVVCGLGTQVCQAAQYRVVPAAADVLAGETLNLTVEVETESGDNLVGVGHFSFAIDLALTGDAAATGNDISNILINETQWDNTPSNQTGAPLGDEWIGVGGVTTDAFAPNFGDGVGDVIELFTFDLAIPATASPSSTITITPREGLLQNVTVNSTFDPVFPQRFTPATITIVPEPTPALLALAAAATLVRRRR
jgi:hypothetical protein